MLSTQRANVHLEPPPNDNSNDPPAPSLPLNEPIVDDSHSEVEDDTSSNDNTSQPHPPALSNAEILRTLQSLQSQVTMFQLRHQEQLETINNLRETNRDLQEELQEERRRPVDRDDSSTSTTTNDDTTMLIRQLIAAQQQNNVLLAQARLDDQRARIESTPAKFPSLKCLSQDSIDSWFPKVISIISGEKYNVFYDAISSSIVADGSTHPSLNSKLFFEILQALSPALQDYIHSKGIANDGIAALHDLTQNFQRPWTQGEKDKHQSKWMDLRLKPNEEILDFFARCIKVRNTSLSHGIPCTENDLRHRFLMGLPATFSSIQERADDLPANWQTATIHQLPGIAQTYLDNKINIRNMHRLTKIESNNANTSKISNNQSNQQNLQQNNQQNVQRNYPAPTTDPATSARQNAIYADIMAGTFNIQTYLSQVPTGACVYHSLAHPGGTMACSAIRRIYTKAAGRGSMSIPVDIQLARLYQNNQRPQQPHVPPAYPPQATTQVHHAPPPRPAPAPYAPQAAHTTVTQSHESTAAHTTAPAHASTTSANSLQEISIDQLHELIAAATDDDSPTTTNNNFNHQSPTYYCTHNNVVICNNVTTINECTPHQILIDSGASHTLITCRSLFQTYSPWDGTKVVTLADGVTTTPIQGTGTISATASNGKIITIPNCLYVPTLSSSLLATKAFSKLPGHGVTTTNGKTKISFPAFSFLSDDNFEDPLIFIMVHPTHVHANTTHIIPLDPDEPNPITLPNDDTQSPTTSDPHTNPDFSTPVPPQSNTPNTIPDDSMLRPKSPSPLPHWLRPRIKVSFKDKNGIVHRGVMEQRSQFQWTITIRKSKRQVMSFNVSKDDIERLTEQGSLLPGHQHHLSNNTEPASAESDSDLPKPPLRVHDIPVSSLPNDVSFTISQIQRGFGFRNVNNILQQIKETSKNNFSISTTDQEPILDLGLTATIDKSKRNTTPVTLPKNFGEVIHMDILYGSATAHGQIKYALYLIDRATRYKAIYPIKDLTTDILPNIKLFCTEMQCIPKHFICDCDQRLFSQEVQDWLTDNDSRITATPEGKQRQNGLAEGTWRTILRLARGWIASSLLPPSYWWFAFKRAVEVSNYVPLKKDNIWTTPHELVFHEKPDLQNLLQMFSVCYVRRRKSDDDKALQNVESHSIAVILVGRSTVANSPIFFHPHTKTTITTDDYLVDETLPAGPAFDIACSTGLHFNAYSQQNVYLRPPTFKPQQDVFAKINDTYHKASVITLPTRGENVYTLQFQHDGSIHQYMEKDIRDVDPYLELDNDHTKNRYFPKWITDGALATMKIDSKFLHGKIHIVNDQFFFKPGRSDKNPSYHLPDFQTRAIYMLRDMSLFKGHPPYKRIEQQRQSRFVGSIVAAHVSARGLSSHHVPHLIEHKRLKPSDKKIWDAAYREEYDGLVNLPAWITITNEQYKSMKNKIKPLPTMAVSTIKFDEDGQPKRAKYRIVALGNLDHNDWNKQDTYAPVLSLIELRIMVTLAVHFKRILKSGDFKQAFVQAELPPDEQYILKPPVGCPISAPNTYWLLKRTLYGLKRSPKHWFDRATSLLTDLGLQPLPNAPCIFKGTILPDQPPLFLGLYVDDFVYFSESDEVEKVFQAKLEQKTNVDFMGPVTHFLGHKFQWETYSINDSPQLRVHLSQTAYADNLASIAGLQDASKPVITPYRSGLPVDAITAPPPSPSDKATLKQQLRTLVGCMNWLCQGTRPDIATITSMLAQYQNSPTAAHIQAAKYAIRYIQQTKHLGIYFDSQFRNQLESYIKYPKDPLVALTDANWGSQDLSKIPENKTIPLFKSRSISGHIIFLFGPLHWQSKRQTITARSSAEAEIYATDECVRELTYIRKILTDLSLTKEFLSKPIPIFNDNMACVQWTKNRTTRTIRHIQLRDNAVRENVQNKKVTITHIPGSNNVADIFTKEDRDKTHFTTMRDKILYPPFICNKAICSAIKFKFPTFSSVRIIMYTGYGGC